MFSLLFHHQYVFPGMSIENYNDIKEGDIIECFVMEEVKQ